MAKTKPNERCPCKSGKKFKKCCALKNVLQSGNNNDGRGGDRVRTDGKFSSDRNIAMTRESAMTSGIECITDDLLENVLSMNPSLSLSKEGLNNYFTTLVDGMSRCPHVLYDIVMAILIGLTRGPPFIDKRISLGGGTEPMPLLMWACQWKMLRYNSRNCHMAGDELVGMVLNAGANVNLTLPSNNMNAMFFAVKYANLSAIDLLICAGINVQHRNKFNNSCMYNALEYPRLQVVEKLLSTEQKGGGNMSIYDTFTQNTRNESNNEIVPIGEMSLPDTIVAFLLSENNSILPWRMLGPPTSKDIGETLLLLRQKGARLTKISRYALMTIGNSFDDSFNLPEFSGTHMFKEVSQYLVGTNVPQRFRNELSPFAFEHLLKNNDGDDNDSSSSSGECMICLEEIKKSFTLYCGHSFCRNCIIEYSSMNRETSTEEGEKGCPLCHRILCLDATLQDSSDLTQHISQNRQANKYQDSDILGWQTERRLGHGPSFLKSSQIIEEAKFRGIYNKGRVSSLSSLREQIIQETEQGARLFSVGGTFTMPKELNLDNNERNSKLRLDLAASVSICYAGTDTFICPTNGTSCVDVNINGVPLLARVSNISLYTMISVSLVDELGLKKIESLKSTKFVDQKGKKCKNLTYTCLEPVTVTIGCIDVKLRNVIQISPPIDEMYGIQLGTDFLASAAWCPIDVETGNEKQSSFMRSDREVSYSINSPTENMLRYYSHDGRTAHVPLLPFAPFNHPINFNLSLKASVKFDQCFFCNRVFPDGMCWCETCNATYCDERCQKAGWKLHRRLHKEIDSED